MKDKMKHQMVLKENKKRTIDSYQEWIIAKEKRKWPYKFNQTLIERSRSN